jgi:hypothetical protein
MLSGALDDCADVRGNLEPLCACPCGFDGSTKPPAHTHTISSTLHFVENDNIYIVILSLRGCDGKPGFVSNGLVEVASNYLEYPNT